MSVQESVKCLETYVGVSPFVYAKRYKFLQDRVLSQQKGKGEDRAGYVSFAHISFLQFCAWVSFLEHGFGHFPALDFACRGFRDFGNDPYLLGDLEFNNFTGDPRLQIVF